MTAPYKKRMKGSWTQGKGCKGDGEERQFSRREIRQELAAAEEDYLERHHKGARTKNVRARLEYRVRWYEEVLANDKRREGAGNSWMNYLRSGLDSAKRQLAELNAEEKK